MNDLNTAILWGSVQATAFLLVAIGIYFAARKLSPKVGAMSALATLLILVAIAPMSFSNWPRWDLANIVRNGNAPSESDSNEQDSEDVAALPPNEFSNDGNETQKSDSQSAVNTIFWQTLQRQAALLNDASQSTRPRWTAWLGPIFFVGIVLASAWRLVGLLAVRRQIASSVPIEEPELCELLDVIQAQMSIPGRVELAEAEELSSAATVGWKVPRVLLPSSWRSWTETERHVVLAHELAHIARRDYLTWMIAQLGVLLHFYHPLAHWFARRLRLEQELAADSMAANLVGGRELYLSTLGNLALRTPSESLAWPAQAFLPVRSTFLRRIEMLRQPKSLFESRWATTGGSVSIGCLLMLGIFVCGLRLPSVAVAQESGSSSKSNASKLSELDPQLIPAEINFVAQFQPAGLLADPRIQEYLGESGELLTEETGIKLSDIESVWMIAKPPEEMAATIVRTKEPHSLSSKRGVIVPAQGKRSAFIPWDNRTLVFSHNLQDYLASTKGARLKPTWWKRWNKIKAKTGRAYLNVQSLRSSIPEQSMTASMIGPILTSTRDVFVSLDLEGQTKVAVRFANEDDESAKKVKRTVESLMGIAQNMIEQSNKFNEQAPEHMKGALEAMATMSNELLDSAKVKVKGRNVDVRGSVEGDGGVVAVGMFLPAIQAARAAARRTQSVNNLRQIALAMLNHESANRHFPAASMKAKGSKHPHSWRVAVLPYLGRNDLYEMYRFDEPWDSEANKKLIPLIPDTYKHPDDIREGMASYFVAVGDRTIFSGDEGIEIGNIEDGTSKTLMVLEAKRDIPWTKPEDVTDDVKPKELGWQPGSFNACRADGSVKTYSHEMDEGILGLLLDRADGAPIPPGV